MILTSLELTDFGTYSGSQRIDLAPVPGRPVTLVGGTNGAGKTTILEAILLCLHGRRALGAVGAREYEDHIASRVHVPPKEGAPGTGRVASVRLSFTYAEGGVPTAFDVERSWRRTRGGRIHEDLRLLRDGEEQEDVTGTLTQAFLDSVMPPGLAGLFLFDGEKIQRLADDDSGRDLHEAVRRLLGLDVLERLRTDLRRYVIRPATAGPSEKDVERRAEQVERELAEGRAALREEEQRRDELAAFHREVNVELARARATFDEDGGVFADRRAELERELSERASRAAVAEARLRDLATGTLPLAFAAGYAQRVAERLVGEQRMEEDEAIRRRIGDVAERLVERLDVRSAADGDPVALLRELLAPDDRTRPVVHAVSQLVRAEMLVELGRLPGVATAARAAGDELRAARADAQVLQEVLDQIPEDEDLAPMVAALQTLAAQVAEHEHALRATDERLKHLRHTVAGCEREVARAEQALHDEQEESERRRLALKTVGVLDDFEAQTAAAKMCAVERHTAQYFNRLSRKGELLGAVRIDPESFTVNLERWDGAVLPKARLSAGERQLLAIALLWSLATVSGRALPVVIDTPLARLDAVHRQRLIEDYLPEVSHQVVVLSTDTEIDAAAAAALGGAVARRYLLRHDRERCATTIVDGYPDAARAARAR